MTILNRTIAVKASTVAVHWSDRGHLPLGIRKWNLSGHGSSGGGGVRRGVTTESDCTVHHS
jgi:hypothetical protein